MLTSWQAGQSVAASCWPSVSQAVGLLHALPAAFHTSSSSSSSNSSSSSSSNNNSSSSGSKQLAALVAPNHEFIPQASEQGELLSNVQQESLAIFRRFNISQPYLKGQVILAKVLRSTPRQLLVDPGYYGLNWVSRQELASAAAYDKSGNPIPRKSATINPGEYVKVRLSIFNTPYGDAQLDPVGLPHDVRQKLVWEELEYRMLKGLPVQGRILNPTAGGYAVGVAGYVALLHHGQAMLQQTRRIGVLQEFYIYKMDRQKRRIELSSIQQQPRGGMEELYRRSL